MRLSYKWLPNFKGLLFVIAIGIIISVVVYTNGIVEDLRAQSRRHLTLQVERFRLLFLQDDADALDTYLHEMADKDFPIIVANAEGQPTSWSGLPALDSLPFESAMEEAHRLQEDWVAHGNNPVPLTLPEFGMTVNYYYGDSDYIRKLQYMPWIAMGMVSVLIMIGYIGFTNIKKSEERSVWVGMAREAAHQLGTPLTSLLGWTALLKDRLDDKTIANEIERDINRLGVVADRFNKIGSQPHLTVQPLKPIVEDAAEYIRRRLPHIGGNEVAINVEIPQEYSLPLNLTLFGWAIENMLKNSVEAFKSHAGNIRIVASKSGRRLYIDISDNGCGIPPARHRDIFRPGYTTKERGWGLGLSLVQRIISEVHGGKIFVANSSPDNGTTIRIVLPSD